MRTINWGKFSAKHRAYIKQGIRSSFCVAEGSIRAGKTIDHCIIAAAYLERCPDKFHLASGSTIGNAKLNIGVCNGFGLEHLFRGRCHWGKYRDNEALFIDTQTGEKVVVFAGGGKADSYKRILGNSYGMWIATEINEHYDADDSRSSFIKVAMGRQAAASEPLRLWDLNPSSPNHPIYSQYIDKYRAEKLPGFLYEHFTIHDNASITPEQLAAFIALYDKGSVWYRRDILGERVVAEGLIYRMFADSPNKWAVPFNDVKARRFEDVNIGIDFGGNGSAHAFCAVGILGNTVTALMSERLDSKGMTVETLTRHFLAFCDKVRNTYGRIDTVYCDSAEQAIINSFRTVSPHPIANSRKEQIIDRIRATELMLTTGRFTFVSGACESLVSALASCVWDTKKTDWVRLDDGTTDIDSLDAFEYSWERWIRILTA